MQEAHEAASVVSYLFRSEVRACPERAGVTRSLQVMRLLTVSISRRFKII